MPGMVTFTRKMYQCVHCQRLYVEKIGSYDLACFEPEDQSDAKHILSSIKGAKYRRSISAEWYDEGMESRGLIRYHHVENEQERHDDWDEMLRAYHAVLEKMKQDKTVRYAVIRKNGLVVHEWHEDGD